MNSEYDWAMEQAIQDLHYEAVMERAKKEQCIYLFVEGDSEEKSFDNLLFKSDYDIDKEGIVLANYGGNGNLKNVLKFFKNTLSSERPAIITYDDDINGKKFIEDLKREYNHDQRITFFKIPINPIIKYKEGIVGGSFEEIFDKSFFIESCFSNEFLKDKPENHLNIFLKDFCDTKPWFKQVEKYFYSIQEMINKVDLAIFLSERITEVPETIIRLVDVLKEVRMNYPIKHPDDVELPQIRGLTC